MQVFVVKSKETYSITLLKTSSAKSLALGQNLGVAALVAPSAGRVGEYSTWLTVPASCGHLHSLTCSQIIPFFKSSIFTLYLRLPFCVFVSICDCISGSRPFSLSTNLPV